MTSPIKVLFVLASIFVSYAKSETDYFHIINAKNGYALSLGDEENFVVGTKVDIAKDEQKWSLEANNEKGLYIFNKKSELALASRGVEKDAPVIHYKPNFGPNQLWNLYFVHSGKVLIMNHKVFNVVVSLIGSNATMRKRNDKEEQLFQFINEDDMSACGGIPSHFLSSGCGDVPVVVPPEKEPKDGCVPISANVTGKGVSGSVCLPINGTTVKVPKGNIVAEPKR